jgi:hypothetical protein
VSHDGHKEADLVLGLLCLCVPFTLVSAGFAQADQGTITGLVTDSSGSAVADAQVTLTDTDTSLALQTRSNGDGIFAWASRVHRIAP